MILFWLKIKDLRFLPTYECRYEGDPPRGVEEGSDCNYLFSTCPNKRLQDSPENCIGHGHGVGPGTEWE